ncbi:centromere protein O [Austrofundulus limnaeus]|uniref:Centromere protein O n=1 Tax=Austrofundulus limnaeus TaxID=52670 RepID=A0A2I4CP55_AUSLI|nr:PREDICTED: centromere protein O [Austrofundulus limnaeus]
MNGASTTGVLSLLSLLEVKTRSRGGQPQQLSRVEELKAKVKELRAQRDQLKTEIQIHESLQKLRSSEDKVGTDEEEEGVDKDAESSELWRLMVKHSELTDHLHAHHVIGGYDIINTRRGRGVCVSLATAYEGVYLDTYNLEIDLKPRVRVSRHSVPPFIPLNALIEHSDLQVDLRGFLDSLSRHLNAFVGRRQQRRLVKEQQKSVEVMDSNVLCSVLVLMFSLPTKGSAMLCTLEYADHTRCLPTQVHFHCEDSQLPEAPQWRESHSLLMKTPVHKALTAMKKMGFIL